MAKLQNKNTTFYSYLYIYGVYNTCTNIIVHAVVKAILFSQDIIIGLHGVVRRQEGFPVFIQSYYNILHLSLYFSHLMGRVLILKRGKYTGVHEDFNT